MIVTDETRVRYVRGTPLLYGANGRCRLLGAQGEPTPQTITAADRRDAKAKRKAQRAARKAGRR